MAAYLPISEVSQFTKAWTICGRVVNRSALRSFGKAGGKLFTTDVLDADGAEIRVNFFNQAAEGLDAVLQRGKCFSFSKGALRAANRQYNSTNHKYEIVFEKQWEIEEVPDIAQIQTHKFDFASIASLTSKEKHSKVDLLGVVVTAFPGLEVSTKIGDLYKREIIVADQSDCSINVSLWGEKAKIDDQAFANHPVVALKAVCLKSWNDNLSGTVLPEGDVIFRPAIVEAVEVQKWWTQSDGASRSFSFKSLSHSGNSGAARSMALAYKHVTLAELREAVPQVQTMQVFIVNCRLHCVQVRRFGGELQQLFFDACQEGKGGFVCNKKVDSANFCSACNRVTTSAKRMNLRCQFSDATDCNWVGVFNEPAEAILGFDAVDGQAQESGPGGRDKVEASIARRYYQEPLQLLVRARVDKFNGENKMSVGVFDACPVDPGERGREMLSEIRQMLEN